MVNLSEILFLPWSASVLKGKTLNPQIKIANQIGDVFQSRTQIKDKNKEVIKPYGTDIRTPFIIRGGTVQEIESSLRPYLERLDRQEYETFLKLRSNPDYSNHLGTIVKVINNLERLSPGAHVHIKNWLVNLKNPKDIKKLPLIERYIERLAIHGETELDDALAAFTSLKITPTETLIDNMLTLHRRGGFLRINRLVDPKKPDRLQTLERTIAKLVRNFYDKNYDKDKNVALLCVTGVIQFETTEDDMFAQGGDILMQTLEEGNQKVLLFETDTDKQLPLAEDRAFKATGKNINLYMWFGHGTPNTTNLGYTTKPKLFRKLDTRIVEEIKNKTEHSDYLKLIRQEALAGKPLWNISNLSNGNLTHDDVHFDTSDADVIKSCTKHKARNAKAVFASCSVAAGENSLAETVHKVTGMKTFGPHIPIKGLMPQFHNGDVLQVIYKAMHDGRVFEGTRFPKR